MNVEFDRAQARGARRKEIEDMLRNYPDVEPAALDTLLSWFRHEASSMDVAMLSSVDDLKDAYCAFRKDHLDRSDNADILIWLVLGIAAVAAMVGIGAYLV